MTKMIEFLKGYRSYILGAGVVAVVFAFAIGLIDKGTAEMLISAMGGGAILTLRAAIGNKE